jgi:predicted outer membrane lipoprotein
VKASSSLLACAFVVSALACESQDKRSAEALTRLVATYREAPMSEKEVRARAIEAWVCDAKLVCTAHEECLKSATPTARALAAKREIEVAFAAHQSGASPLDRDAMQALQTKLSHAETDLRAGRDALEGCAAEIAALRHRLDLR